MTPDPFFDASDEHDDDALDLRTRLHDAADGHPVGVPDLLPRARSVTRRRHLARIAVATVGALVLAGTGTLLVERDGSSHDPRTAIPAGSPTTSASTSSAATGATATGATATGSTTAPGAVLGSAEIVRRCLPQLQGYARTTGHSTRLPLTTSTVSLAHADQQHRVGEVVELRIPSQLPTSPADTALRPCLVPAAGHEKDAVPASALQPASLGTQQVLDRCSNAQVVLRNTGSASAPSYTPEFEGSPDLRQGRVLRRVLLSPRFGLYLVTAGGVDRWCALASPTALLGSDRVDVLHSSVSIATVGSAVDSAGGAFTSRYYGGGKAPTGVARIVFTQKGSTVAVVRPDAEGRWIVGWSHAETSSDPYAWVLYSASGAVVSRGQSR